ncbi:ATP-binding protein [Undibacterium sp. Ji49W]|uniref:ATP-binding protein n=1 Tax=Undibacterium sp. Ji49W TaxID=3413040 RepID=UPI003BF049F9
MDANIRGLADRLDLAPSRGIMSLFEAISNAIDAIEETKRGYSNCKITIKLIGSHDLAQQAGDDTLTVDGFDVIDNGVGFTDENMQSFGVAYTLSKVKIGGKGVGRFTFLKVFSMVCSASFTCAAHKLNNT